MMKPDPRRQALQKSTSTQIHSEEAEWLLPGAGEADGGGKCLKGQFRFGNWKSSGGGWWRWGHKSVNILTTELHTDIWLRRYIFVMYISPQILKQHIQYALTQF